MIGTVFKIETEGNTIFYGCVTNYFPIDAKRNNTIGFVILENSKSIKRIARIIVPAGIKYTFFTSHKWVKTHWEVIGKLDIEPLPEKLHIFQSGNALHDFRRQEIQLRFIEDNDKSSYQTLSIGNYYAAEYVLDRATIEFIDVKQEHIIFS